MKLYELLNQYQQVLDMFTDPELDGEFDGNVVTDTLESITGDIETKITNYAAMVKTMEAEAEAIKAAMQAMEKREKALKNRADWLKGYALSAMKETGIDKIECPWFRVSVTKNPASVVVDTEVERLPPFYIREKLIREADKAAIKADLEAGKPVTGCRLEQGYRLSIR